MHKLKKMISLMLVVVMLVTMTSYSFVEDTIPNETKGTAEDLQTSQTNDLQFQTLNVTTDSAFQIVPDLSVSLLSVEGPGTGTETDPYVIRTADDLMKIKDKPTAFYKLVNDIDLTGIKWEPLCASVAFTGTLDGNGFSISNMTVEKANATTLGLFSKMNGTILNLTMNKAKCIVTGSGGQVGAIAGSSTNGKYINCSVTESIIEGYSNLGSLVGGANVTQFSGIKVEKTKVGSAVTTMGAGGIAGGTSNCNIEKCSVDATLVAKQYAGGISGNLYNSKVSQVQTFGEIKGEEYLAGIGGSFGNQNPKVPIYCEVTDSASYMNIIGVKEIGGLVAVGYSHGAILKTSLFAGKIIFTNSANIGTIGGLINNGSGTTNCYYDAEKTNLSPRNTGEIGRITKSMLKKSNYLNWNFDGIWDIQEGKTYPYLKEFQSAVNSSGSIIPNGDGTEKSPYEITNADQLKLISNETSAFYKLMNDIDLSGIKWEALCNNVPFTGTLDGNGFSISNMTVEKANQFYVGLFAKMDGTVCNLTMNKAKSTITGSGGVVGAIAGTSTNAKYINCSVIESIIDGYSSLGGLVGSASATQFSGIKVGQTKVGSAVTTMGVGGIVGGTSSCNIEKCSVDATLMAKQYAGGISGNLYNSKVSQVQTFGEIKGEEYLAGIGGSFGNQNPKVPIYCEVTDCASYMNITGVKEIGGLAAVGYGHGAILKTSLFAGKINFTNSANTGTIGGLINNGGGTTNCYYDAEKTNLSPRNTGEIGRITKSMLKKSNYLNWNFDSIWDIQEGKTYPYLKEFQNGVNSAGSIIPNGDGTEKSPYEITNADQLKLISNEVSAFYRLMNDIDLSGIKWEPLCASVPFTGTLDGNGFSINNMTVEKANAVTLGLFSKMDGTVLNLTMNKAKCIVTGSGGQVGTIAGNSTNGKYINCSVTESIIDGYSNLGSLVGGANVTQFSGIKVEKTKVGSAVTTMGVGGIAGGTSNCNIEKCSVDAILMAKQYVGGISGNLYNSKVSQVQTFGEIKGEEYLAGIGGSFGNQNPKVPIYCEITDCASYMQITGVKEIGGLIAVGYGHGAIQKTSLFAGKINFTNSGNISTIGGLINNGSGTTNCLYDAEKTGLKPRNTYEIGKTTKEMFTKSTYPTWNFDSVWAIQEGIYYPILKNVQFLGSETSLLLPPNKLTVSEITARTFKLSWTPAQQAESYDVKVGSKIYNTANIEMVISDLEPETVYQVSVATKAKDKVSSDSEIKNVTTLASTIATPKITSVELANGQMVINWTAIGGIKKYELSINGEIVNITGVKGTYTLKNVKDNTTYQFKVRAIGVKDKSKWSDLVTKKTKDEYGMTGQGTDADPYVILEESHFARINKEPSASYMIGQDITLTSAWTPLCIDKPFTGKIFGNKKKIIGLNIVQKNQQNIGFIATVKGAEIRDLKFENPIISSEGTNVGVLIGKSDQVVLKNVKVTGATVEGSQYVAGLVGILNDTGVVSKTIIENCSVSSSTINCKGSYAAGLVASLVNGQLLKSKFEGTISNNLDYAGGLVAVANKAVIDQCYTVGQILGKNYLAGICAYMTNSSLNNAFSRMEIKAQTDSPNCVAGLVSSFSSDGNVAYYLKNSYFNGKITSLTPLKTKVGGVVHTTNRTDCITNNYYDGLKIGYESKFIQDPQNSRLTGAMKSKNNYIGWDFEKIWIIDNGRTYPTFIDGESFDDPDSDLYKTQPLGSGTEESPYLLTIPEQFKFLEVQPGAYYKVINDIDFTNFEWTPLCKDRPFTGTIDGSGYTLENISVNTIAQANLFQSLDKAKLQNIVFKNINIQGDDEAYIFRSVNGSQLKNIVISGNVTSLKGKASLIQNLTAGSIVEGLETSVIMLSKDSASGVVETCNSSTLNKLLINGQITSSLVSGVAQNFNGTANEVQINATILANKGYGFTSAADNATIKNVVVSGSIEAQDVAGSDVSCTGLLQDANKGTKTTVENVLVYSKLKAKRGMVYPIIANDSVNVTTSNAFYVGDYMNCVPLTAKQSDQSILSQNVNSEVAKFKDASVYWTIEESNYPVLKQFETKAIKQPIMKSEKMSGEGTKASPYIIQTLSQANLMKYAVNKSFSLGNDIDFENNMWIPVGTKDAPFTGDFDGGGFAITNLKIVFDSTTDWGNSNYLYKDFGLFGVVKNSKISNLSIKDWHITTDLIPDMKAGLIAGTIENATVSGILAQGENVITSFTVGGITGYALNSNLNNLRLNTELIGDSCVGGVIGKSDKSVITDAAVVLKGSAIHKSIGGIIGNAYNTSKLIKCYARVTLTGEDEVGGLVGLGKTLTIQNSGSSGTLESNLNAQGIVGKLSDYTTDLNVFDKVYSACNLKSTYSDVSYLKTKPTNMTLTSVFLLDEKNTASASYAKTDKQLKEKATFTGYDFSQVWSIEENVYYPLLKGSEQFIKTGMLLDIKPEEIVLEGKMDDGGLALSWSSTTPYSLYKVYIDGKLQYEGDATSFNYGQSIDADNVSVYVEGYLPNLKKMKSNTLTIPTIVYAPKNLKYEVLGDKVKLTWDCNGTNCKHTIELNGVKVGITSGHEYTFLVKDLKKENIVRVMNQKGSKFSKWSAQKIISLVKSDFKGLRVVELERTKVGGKTQVKAQLTFSNMKNQYAGYLVVKFDPKKFNIDEASVKEAFESSTTYLKVSVNNELGYMKILFTKKADSDTNIEALINFNVILIKNMTAQLDMTVMEIANDEQMLMENLEFIEKEFTPLIED